MISGVYIGNMPKGLIRIVVALVILVVLGVAAFTLLKKNKPVQNLPKTSIKQPENNVFSSIQDALSKSLSLQCDYTDTNGIKTVAYIKNGAVRGDITGKTPDASGSIIVKDKKMWFWNDKGGFTLDVPDITPSANSQTGNNPQNSQEQNLMSSLEQYKNSCKTAVVADSLFVPPVNIQFQDMSKLVPSIPSGVPKTSGAPSQEQINKMIQQYQTSPTP